MMLFYIFILGSAYSYPLWITKISHELSFTTTEEHSLGSALYLGISLIGFSISPYITTLSNVPTLTLCVSSIGWLLLFISVEVKSYALSLIGCFLLMMPSTPLIIYTIRRKIEEGMSPSVANGLVTTVFACGGFVASLIYYFVDPSLEVYFIVIASILFVLSFISYGNKAVKNKVVVLQTIKEALTTFRYYTIIVIVFTSFGGVASILTRIGGNGIVDPVVVSLVANGAQIVSRIVVSTLQHYHELTPHVIAVVNGILAVTYAVHEDSTAYIYVLTVVVGFVYGAVNATVGSLFIYTRQQSPEEYPVITALTLPFAGIGVTVFNVISGNEILLHVVIAVIGIIFCVPLIITGRYYTLPSNPSTTDLYNKIVN